MAKPLKALAKSKPPTDLFADSEAKGRAASKTSARSSGAEGEYTARDIEVLEGLEPVRRRPGMYIGGTDEKALHHLFAEVIDNSMDEALAGHADRIEVELGADGFLSVTDNGRGIPVDPHPKFPKKSALEVILCTLHAGGKFDSKVYETSGGLHGVGVSVVNALSSRLEVEVARGQKLYRMAFERGHPKGRLEELGKVNNRRGTTVRFKPDADIFGAKAAFKPQRLFKMARSKAYLFGGVEIRWRCAPELLKGVEDVPPEASFHFPGGLKDYLAAAIHADTLVHPDIFSGKSGRNGAHGACEWAVAWTADADGFLSSYCNTVPTPDGGTLLIAANSFIIHPFFKKLNYDPLTSFAPVALVSSEPTVLVGAPHLALGTLAELVDLSPYHFARAFKQSFGVPPHRYHVSRRIERAKELLAAPSSSVTDVALAVGFAETSSFSAAFRKTTGYAPSEYRRGLG